MKPDYITNPTLASDFWSIQLVEDIADPNEKQNIQHLETNEHLETVKLAKKILSLNEGCKESELIDELMNVAISTDLLIDAKKKINELTKTINQLTDTIRNNNLIISDLKEENKKFAHLEDAYLTESKDSSYDKTNNKLFGKKKPYLKPAYNMDTWKTQTRPAYRSNW